MPCLKAFHVKQTSKALPESFIKSGEFYKKRSVVVFFAQPGLGGRFVCAGSCCCCAERVLLRSSGKATAFCSNRSCATATLPRRRRQKQSAAVFAPERLFSGLHAERAFFESANRTPGKNKKNAGGRRGGAPLRQKQRPRPVFLTETLRIFRAFERRPTPRRHGGAVPPPFKKGVESRRLSEPVFPWQRQERGNVSRGTAGKGVGQKSFCNLRKTLAKKKGR